MMALLEHIRDAEWADFVATLPSLRRAFTQLTPAETATVAARAAESSASPPPRRRSSSPRRPR